MNTKIIHLLNEYNIKPTPMRMLVLEQFLLQSRNLTLTEIEEFLYPSDRITIYRTLQTFIKHGIAHSIESINGSIYALCSDNCKPEIHYDNHPHFFCEACKKITCTNDFVYHIESKSNSIRYLINKVEISLKGLCPDCAGR